MYLGCNEWFVGVASPPGRKPNGLEAATITRVIAVSLRQAPFGKLRG